MPEGQSRGTFPADNSCNQPNAIRFAGSRQVQNVQNRNRPLQILARESSQLWRSFLGPSNVLGGERSGPAQGPR